eukprot:TRINITY_DN340_c0_g1_i5.p1 TRINITY_DN340_c0_g1~~TRINITY_DN340_c0_g1_i5.p1  ORF type:complete len:384 (-),score=55.43 TRINITY_DN340_c0_g1_i5:912-2003(-)
MRKRGIAALSELKITFGHHSKYPNVICLHYKRIGADFNLPITRECRGLVIDQDTNKVLAFPFRKFFNYAEKLHHKIDWKSARVYPKVDGTLMTLYFYKKEWHVATSSIPDGSKHIVNSPVRQTYAQLFWKVWKKKKYKLPEIRTRCYMFELFSPENPIIVKPTKDKLVFLGARDLNTFEELKTKKIAEDNNWVRLESISTFKSITDLIQAAADLNPVRDEGFVVIDKFFSRLKVKGPKYVALAGLDEKNPAYLNVRKMLGIVKTNEGSEFLSYFKEWLPLFTKVNKAFDEYLKQLQSDWATGTAKPAEKEFLPPFAQETDLREILSGVEDRILMRAMQSRGCLEDTRGKERARGRSRGRKRGI